jgi:hypothetical protein
MLLLQGAIVSDGQLLVPHRRLSPNTASQVARFSCDFRAISDVFIELHRYTPEQAHLIITMEWMDCYSLADAVSLLPLDAQVPLAVVRN